MKGRWSAAATVFNKKQRLLVSACLHACCLRSQRSRPAQAVQLCPTAAYEQATPGRTPARAQSD